MGLIYFKLLQQTQHCTTTTSQKSLKSVSSFNCRRYRRCFLLKVYLLYRYSLKISLFPCLDQSCLTVMLPPLALFLKSQQVELISKSGLTLLILHINLLINGHCKQKKNVRKSCQRSGAKTQNLKLWLESFFFPGA